MQQSQEEIKQLENKLEFSKEICTFSDKFLILEDLQSAPSLREDQLPGYLKIIESIVDTYFNMRNLDPQQNSLLNENLGDFLILNIFMEKIDAFCQIASDSIRLGNANTLICITETLKEYKDRVLKAHTALSDSLSKEECYEKNEQFWMEWYETMVLKPPTATLSPPPWKLQ